MKLASDALEDLRAPRGGRPAAPWSLAQAVWLHSQERPHALALASAAGALSYAQLARQAAGLARHLAAVRAAQAADGVPRIGILASRSAEACIAALGSAWAGATYVPLGLNLPPERLSQVLARCGLSALVTDAQGARLLEPDARRVAPAVVRVLGPLPPPPGLGAGVQWLPPHELAALAPQPPAPMPPEAAAYILFTSGTTGQPKGVVVPVRAVAHYVPTMTSFLGLTPQDRVLDLFELGFDVSVHNLFCTWQAGASLHMLAPAQVMNAVRFVRAHGLTVWNSVPALVAMLGQVGALTPGAMPSLRLSSFGGEPLSLGLVQAWRRAAPRSEVYNLYGPTEATVTCLAQRLQPPWPVGQGSDVLAIGRPLPGCEAAVLDPQGHERAPGEAGELAVAGAQLATGYLDDPAQTAERFVERQGRRWYLTGDRAVCDGDGLYHCLGRLDHQVKVRGHRVELEDVEAHLRQVLGAPLVAALPWPGPAGAAQGLVAFVAAPQVDESRALQALRSRLPAYMVPARLRAVPQMPTNANGKIDRQALRRLLEVDAG